MPLLFEIILNKTLMQLKYSLLSLATAALVFTACDDDVNTPVTPQAPDTYAFENVDYSGQTARINLLSDLETLAKSGSSQAVAEADLLALYNNTNQLYNTDKKLADKVYGGQDGLFNENITALFADLSALSQDAVRDGNVSDGYLIDTDGREPAQLIAKGLMSGLLYHQAVNVYLGADKMNVDNSEVTEGKGTAMQHHWDEAFGYFGAGTDFPAEGSEARYWASYAQKRSDIFDVRQSLMDAFIKGRFAINQNDVAARDEAIETIRIEWEKLAAANVVHYINQSLSLQNTEADMSNQSGKFYHAWSEALGFAWALGFGNEGKTMTNTQYTQLVDLLGDNPTETDRQKLQQAWVLLQGVYGFSDEQMQNL